MRVLQHSNGCGIHASIIAYSRSCSSIFRTYCRCGKPNVPRCKMARSMTNCLTLVSIVFFVAAASVAQTARPGMSPRTPDGHPDLQGIWNNATLTPLERGIAYAFDGKRISLPTVGTLTVADSEATAYEQRVRTVADFKRGDGSEGDVSGEWNHEFIEFAGGLARVNGWKRTSLIVDPHDGRIPYLATDEQRERSRPPESFDSVKDRDLDERCLHFIGTPILPNVVYRVFQIVQTPNDVMIMAELLHEVRIIRIGGQHLSPGVGQWMGDSIGHWEGDALVVDTTNFNAQAKFMGASKNLHVVERFKPIDGNTFLYSATVEDPSVFSKPWVIEYPFLRASAPIYEYACHEGNYALPAILKGARKSEAENAKP